METETITNEQNEKLEIIVVDDRAENIAAARQYFETRPEINVTYATSYDEAAKLMDEYVYAAGLFDLELPRTAGTQTKQLGFELADKMPKMPVFNSIFN